MIATTKLRRPATCLFTHSGTHRLGGSRAVMRSNDGLLHIQHVARFDAEPEQRRPAFLLLLLQQSDFAAD